MHKSIDYIDYNSSFKNRFIKSYFNQCPCIIKSCITDWSSTSWNLTDLREVSCKEEIRGNLDGVYIRDPKTQIWHLCNPKNIAQIREKLNVNLLEYQAQEWLFSLSHPEMLKGINIPTCLKNPKWLNLIPLSLRPIYPRILIGYENTGSQLHIDVCHTANWMALVKGIKKWFVVDPEEGSKLQQYMEKFVPDTSELENKVDSYYKFELKAGELLYLPGKWLHQVYNTEDSIAITYNLFNFCQASKYCFDSLNIL